MGKKQKEEGEKRGRKKIEVFEEKKKPNQHPVMLPRSRQQGGFWGVFPHFQHSGLWWWEVDCQRDWEHWENWEHCSRCGASPAGVPQKGKEDKKKGGKIKRKNGETKGEKKGETNGEKRRLCPSGMRWLRQTTVGEGEGLWGSCMGDES